MDDIVPFPPIHIERTGEYDGFFLSIRAEGSVVREMVDGMSSTCGSSWEIDPTHLDFAYNVIDDVPGMAPADLLAEIVGEIEQDGFAVELHEDLIEED